MTYRLVSPGKLLFTLVFGLGCLVWGNNVERAAAADPSGWKLAFTENFDRNLLGHHWKPLGGAWTISNGWLSGKEGQILCTLRFPEPQRIVYEARSTEVSAVGDHRISDLTALLAANEAGYMGGYFVGFGSENNTCSKILVQGKEIARYDTRITPFKTHHVVCQFDGETLTQMIDGKVVRQEKPETRLTGGLHQMIGFYMWETGYVDNVKVYTRTGEAIEPASKKIAIPSAVDSGLVANGSFEELIPGLEPPLPNRWLLQRWSRQDTVELVWAAAEAHRGRRFLRAYAPGIHGVRMHSTRAGGIQMKPGTTYLIRLWARKLPGTSAVLTTEPGGDQFELTEQWQLYSTRYQHPADESSSMGMYFAVEGGPADVDDVSIVEDGNAEPVTRELAADWQGLAEVDAADTWTEPRYAWRIPVTLEEVVGEDAVNYPVSVSVRALFRTYELDFFRPEKITVVDPSTKGGSAVPFAIMASDRNPNLSQDDRLIFLVNCPARSRKTVYIYVRDFERGQRLFTPTDLIPEAVNVASDYPHRLAVDIHLREPRYSVTARMEEGRLEAAVQAWTAASATAELISPDGTQRLPVPLSLRAPGHWRVAEGYRPPQDILSGVWRLQIEYDDGPDTAVTRSAALVIGNALWCGNNSERIYEDDPPRYGKGEANLAAAGDQWESFQIAVASETGLQDVRMRATDLKRQGGAERLGAEEITIDCVEQALVVEGFRGGDTPDPLLPWETEDVKAGRQRVAYVTLKVPEGLPAGLYTGRMIAENGKGVVGELPVTLEVFPFSLPKSRSFTPVIAAGFSAYPYGSAGAGAAKARQTGRFRFEANYAMSHRRATMDMLRLLGERHMTPFYYSSTTAPYKIPWTYNRETKTADMDFSFADEGLALTKSLDVKYLFFNAENRVREHGGCMYAHLTGTDDAVYGWHGTEQGRDMFQARMKPLADYLQRQGWAERTLFYTNDERFGHKTSPPLKGRDHNALVTEYSRMIHAVDAGFQTFTADNAGGKWIAPLDETDHFTGVMSNSNQERFRKQGSVWWGLYNRYTQLSRPLAVCRIIGLDCHQRGWDHHFQLEAHYASIDPWINLYRYSHSGSKSAYFIAGGGWQGFSHHVYPWPEWRQPWNERLPALVSSLRIEALRESIDDYEYVQMLADAAGRLPAGSVLHQRCLNLLEKAETFVAKSNLGDDYRYGGSHSVFQFDGDELDNLMREIGRAIAAASSQ